MLQGTVVENSLRDKTAIQGFEITKSWSAGSWRLYQILIDRQAALKFGSLLEEGPWYVHFWEPGSDQVIAVFRDKVFTIQYSKQETWTEAVAYGKSIGIPEEQLDFLIQ